MRFSRTNPWRDAAWIWTGDGVSVNQHVLFRRTFVWGGSGGPNPGELLVSAGHEYVAYLNGGELGRGQYPDHPGDKTFTRWPLAGLRPGENVLAILAYHGGPGFSAMPDETPRLAAVVVPPSGPAFATDAAWNAVPHPAYQQGDMPKRTAQLGYTACYDARVAPDAWTRIGFDDRDWPAARVGTPVSGTGEGGGLRERPVPPCRLGGIRFGTAVKQGWLRREASQVEEPRFALACDRDEIRHAPPSDVFPASRADALRGSTAYSFAPPPDDANGYFVIVDLGEECVGFLHLDMDVPAGTVVDISHGEHLDDGRVRMAIGARNFTDRHIARGGRDRWDMPFRRYGARYLQLSLFPPAGKKDGPVTVHGLGLSPWTFPLPEAAPFDGGDPGFRDLRAAAVNTLRLCLHEHYEDCPWREQALYAYDGRNQALYGYYLWGNYAFARESFALLARGARADGQLALCAPTRLALAIPAFTLVWTAAAREHFLHSGDDTLYRLFANAMEDRLGQALERRAAPDEPAHSGSDPHWWHFYEWSPGLSGRDGEAPPADEFHAAYQLYLVEALDAFADMAGYAGDAARAVKPREEARRVAKAFDRHFWDRDRRVYASTLKSGSLAADRHEHIQLLALATGATPDGKREALFAALSGGLLQPAQLSVLPYLPRALMESGAEARRYVRAQIDRRYLPMARATPATLWETEEGGRAFNGAGSLCHAWSSLPAYYAGACVLGVGPLDPGFRRFRVKPWADGRFPFAEGTVPTPAGPIRAGWRRERRGLRLRLAAPRGCEAVVESYPECPVVRVEEFPSGNSAP